MKDLVRSFGRVDAGVAYQLNKTVVMVGMMGAGKTAVGGALARMLGVPFRDSDAEIVAAANMGIAEIFARDGEDFFREKETRVIARLLQDRPAILSTGGGAYMSARNREMITRDGFAVWLQVELDLLWARVRHRDTRPLLHTDNPYETLKTLCAAREPSYALADLTVAAQPSYSVEDMAGAVLDKLAGIPRILEGR